MEPKQTFHELMKPKLQNLLNHLRKCLAEENCPAAVEQAYLSQFTVLTENAEAFENFVEQTMLLFWKKNPEPPRIGMTECYKEYYLDFEEMDKSKAQTTATLEAAKMMRQVTEEQYHAVRAMMSYEMKPENKALFRRYLSMFCQVRHDANNKRASNYFFSSTSMA
jgi:hypothetical protein